MGIITITIHGGAGTIQKKSMTDELERAYKQGLGDAVAAGYGVLEKGGSAMDAVVAATASLEDNVLFNAGKGSVFGYDGSQEMDAAVMDGKSLMAGAVAGVRNIRNPVRLAQTVMTHSSHVMLVGRGAEEFARSHGIEEAPDAYFFSQNRFDQWKKMQGSGEVALDHNVQLDEKKFGTVGAAAVDCDGNVAAATSTGGMTNKQWGRIGDSPVIGAGTYANNKTCAISCTGHGEFFLRTVAAYDVSCLMEYKGLSLEEAMRIVVFDKLLPLEGEGGMVGVDAKGNAAMIFNSEGMYRAVRNSNGLNQVAIYSGD